jgi:hypothetical protein
VKISYFGYHTIPEGLSLFNEIKSNMNNFRLTTNKLNHVVDNNLLLEKISDLFSKPAIYEIRNGVRFLAGTNKLVSEKLNIVVVDREGKKQIFSSISSASKSLNFGRKTIKDCLLSNRIYNGYSFYYGN